jgi:hypothetical protein
VDAAEYGQTSLRVITKADRSVSTFLSSEEY